MKSHRLILGLVVMLAGAGAVRAQLQDTVDDLLSKSISIGPSRPAQDPKRMIKESNSFLKEREPEMTTEEYAIYERVNTMLNTNVDLAIKMLEAMMTEKEPPSPAFQFILGNAYSAANQFARAEASYRGAVDRYPSFLRAWTNLGLLYYANNRYADAATCFAKSVSLGDRQSATLGLLGYNLEQQGDPIAAGIAYEQALSSDPKNTDWKEGLLRLALSAKHYGRAEQLVRDLIVTKPTETHFWLSYAGIMVADGRKFEAMAILERAQSIRVLDAEALVMLGDLYAEQGLAADAAAIYGKVLAASPARGEQKLLQFAQVLVASGNLADAERTLATIKGELSPAARLTLLQTRADLAMARKRWPEARREAEALLALAPLNGRALLTLGRTYLEENNLPQAALAFEAAVQVPDSAYQANLELANVELKNRHYGKAVSLLEKALKIQRDDSIEDYLARIRPLADGETKSG